MKTIYCCPNFPFVTAMELNQPQEIMSDLLLRPELRRLIAEESPNQDVPINQAMDLLVMPERPSDRRDLLDLLMETDEIQLLLRETEGQMMVEADEDTKEEYQQKTFYSFLIDLTNWLETR